MKNSLLIGMIAAAGFVGCSTTEQPTESRQQVVVECPKPSSQFNSLSPETETARVDNVPYRQVILDGVQTEWLPVQNVRRSKTNDGYERVQVQLKNMTTAPLRVRYRFEWQDADGVVRSDLGEDASEKITVAPGSEPRLSSIAPRKDCVDFKLQLKLIR